MIKKTYNMVVRILRIAFKPEITDKKVDAIYSDPLKKAKQVNISLKQVNKLLYHKDTTYHIARAMGLKLKPI